MQPKSAPRPPKAKAEPLLRPITAGYDIDRWPIAVKIAAEESVEGWLWRAASRYSITPRDLITEAAPENSPQSPIQAAKFIRRHSDLLARKLGCVSSDVANAAAEMHPNAAIVDYLLRYRGTTRRVTRGLAFCPACLARPNPVWKREWASVFSIACPEHRCLLVRTCPRCGEPPFSTASWLSAEPDTPAYLCTSRMRRHSGRMINGERCHFDFRSMGLFEMDTAAIDAHTGAYRLWSQYIHAPDGLAHLTGIEVTHTIAFDAFCQLVDEPMRIVALFEETFHRPSLVQAMRNAHLVLASASTSAAAERATAAGLLNPGGQVTPVGPDNVLLRRRRNPLLAAIRLSAVRSTLSPATQLTFDCGHRYPRYPLRENDDRQWLRLPEHLPDLPDADRGRIPQVLWPTTVWDQPADASPLIAAAQAMALAKIGDTRPWSVIALDLGLPKGIAIPVTRYWQGVVRTGRWPEALTALTELKEQLRQEIPPIDYQQRRIIADDPRRLVRALAATGARTRTTNTEHFHQLIRRYWELLTGGDVRLARPPFGHPTAVDDWPNKRATLDAEYGEVFTNAFLWMKQSQALRPSGPLTWHPP